MKRQVRDGDKMSLCFLLGREGGSGKPIFVMVLVENGSGRSRVSILDRLYVED